MTAYVNPLHRYPSYDQFASDIPVAGGEYGESVKSTSRILRPTTSMDTLAPVPAPRRHQEVNFFILFIFILELLVLVFVSVLAYFLR